jgi:FkbM family methyltransferase
MSIDSSFLNKIHNMYPVFSTREWNDEIVEQYMSVLALKGTEKVLEIGSCIGRNSIVIGHMLKEGGRLVTIESNPDNIPRLRKSIADSGLTNISICDKPISKSRMIVHWWQSKIIGQGDDVPKGWREVETTTLKAVNEDKNIDTYDTLVLDCEGAFYSILKDFPEIMNGVKCIIIENDFSDKKHADYVHNVFKQQGFTIKFSRALKIKGINFPCKGYFWQIWQK